MTELPKAFLDRLAGQLGDELPAFLHGYEEPAARGLRINPLKTASECPETEGTIPYEPCGHYIPFDSDAGTSVLHEAGAYYLQEPAAMLPAAVLDPQPGEWVLDLCAAPGGKSTHIAGRMRGEGILVCNEPVPKRAAVLSRNLERMGVTNAIAVSAMPEKLANRWGAVFDRIMVDAPCSGEGMFRRHPETRDEWSPEMAAGCAERQSEILDQAARMLKSGGIMVYATCSLNPAENEENVKSFCLRHPDFEPVPFQLPGVDAPQGMYTCYHHRLKGEGQFVALLRRHGESTAVRPVQSFPAPDKNSLAALRSFVRELPENLQQLGSTIVSLPPFLKLDGLKVLRAGLHLGEVRGKLFIPDHAWAVSARPPAFPRIPLSSQEAETWLRGETIDREGSGYVLPEYAGLCLGWGKISTGIMKNHYPKGLRRP